MSEMTSKEINMDNDASQYISRFLEKMKCLGAPGGVSGQFYIDDAPYQIVMWKYCPLLIIDNRMVGQIMGENDEEEAEKLVKYWHKDICRILKKRFPKDWEELEDRVEDLIDE